MKIHINKKSSLNYIIFYFILSIGLLNGYFGGAAVGFAVMGIFWNTGIIVVFLAEIMEYVVGKKYDKGMVKILLLGGTLFVLFLMASYIFGVNQGYARKNTLTICKVLIVDISLMLLACNFSFDIFKELKKCFWGFNIWGFLNMLVLSLQLVKKGFMMPAAWLSMNSYYEDLCAGLFGYNGTHRLGIYMTFLFIYNLYIAEFEIKQRKRKKQLYAYNILLLAWHFGLSTQNDNMTIYILTILFFLSYVFMDMHWRHRSISSIIVKWSKYIIAAAIVIIVMFIVPLTREFIVDGIINRIVKLTSTSSANRSSGSTERLSIVLYSFENGFGYKFGKGIGYWPFGGDFDSNNHVGFRHFGLSSMSSMVYLLGVWFYLFVLVWVSKIYRRICKSNDRWLLLVILGDMLFLTFYTTNLTSSVLSVNLMLLFSVFGMMGERIKENETIANRVDSDA